MTKYLINWDNGANACGTFPQEYDTYEEAQAAADNILAENAAQGVWIVNDDEDYYGPCAFVEVIEVGSDEPDPEEINAAEEQTLAYFDRYIAGDR